MSLPESNEIRVSLLAYVNIYTTMLALSALAMLIAVVLLLLELSALEWDSSARTISSRGASAPVTASRAALPVVSCASAVA